MPHPSRMLVVLAAVGVGTAFLLRAAISSERAPRAETPPAVAAPLVPRNGLRAGTTPNLDRPPATPRDGAPREPAPAERVDAGRAVGSPIDGEAIEDPPNSPDPVRKDPSLAQFEGRQALQEENLTLRRRVMHLESQLHRKTIDLARCENPLDTPFGAFLASPEGEELSDDPEIVERLSYLFEEFPVMLQPGEATWLADRLRRKDWTQWGSGRRTAIFYFLGVDRVLAELEGTKALEEHRKWMDDHEWQALVGR